MQSDIRLLDKAVAISGDTTVTGRFGIVAENLGEGKKHGVALAHAAGDVLKINQGQSYEGGVSFDGPVKFGNVTVKPGASSSSPHELQKCAYGAKIHSNTILFETTPITAPGFPSKTTTLDLVATIHQLLDDVAALKAKVAALQNK